MAEKILPFLHQCSQSFPKPTFPIGNIKFANYCSNLRRCRSCLFLYHIPKLYEELLGQLPRSGARTEERICGEKASDCNGHHSLPPHPSRQSGSARENGGARPSPQRLRALRLRRALPLGPTTARWAVATVEGGRGEGKERSTTPHQAPQRAVPVSPAPAPAPTVRARPLRTSSRSEDVGRAPCFPSSPLCPGARRRERGNARRAVRLRKEAGRRALSGVGSGPCSWSPSPAPPPTAISCSSARGLRMMDARKPGQQRPQRRGCSSC